MEKVAENNNCSKYDWNAAIACSECCAWSCNKCLVWDPESAVSRTVSSILKICIWRYSSICRPYRNFQHFTETWYNCVLLHDEWPCVHFHYTKILQDTVVRYLCDAISNVFIAYCDLKLTGRSRFKAEFEKIGNTCGCETVDYEDEDGRLSANSRILDDRRKIWSKAEENARNHYQAADEIIVTNWQVEHSPVQTASYQVNT